jgi:hypothetical protein
VRSAGRSQPVVPDPGQWHPHPGQHGKNADPVAATTGSNTTGVSAGLLDTATIAKTAALTFKIVGLSEQAGNEMGQYAVLVVKLNQHQYGSVGVAADGA